MSCSKGLQMVWEVESMDISLQPFVWGKERARRQRSIAIRVSVAPTLPQGIPHISLMYTSDI